MAFASRMAIAVASFSGGEPGPAASMEGDAAGREGAAATSMAKVDASSAGDGKQ